MTKHRKRRTSTAAPRQRRRAPRRTRRARGPLSEKKNTALLAHELSEAREQQAATSEVLRVISSSPGDLKPVFETMLANAVRICEAKYGLLLLYDGKQFRAAALHDLPPAYADAVRAQPVAEPRPGDGLLTLVDTKQVVQIADVAIEPAY